MLNKPATAREKIRVHMTVFPPTDGITCFDGIETRRLENMNSFALQNLRVSIHGYFCISVFQYIRV